MHAKIKDIALIAIYILFGVLTRTVWHIAPNVEFVTAFAIAGAYFIQKRYSLSIPFGIMAISDFIIGNSPIYLFTWSAFGVAWIVGRLLSCKKVKQIVQKPSRILRNIVASEFAGVAFTIFFFLWTNFGVVVVSNMYPKTLEGLLRSYAMGLPFLVPQLIGNVIIVPIVFLMTGLFYKVDLKFVPKFLLGEK